jgi:hypothetical protein
VVLKHFPALWCSSSSSAGDAEVLGRPFGLTSEKNIKKVRPTAILADAFPVL